MTSNHHAPYVLGYTRATMAITKSSETVTLSESQKGSLSSDCGLQPAHMKPELLVIPNQNVGVVASNPESACRGECVPGSCTHRPSRHGSWEYPKSAS